MSSSTSFILGGGIFGIEAANKAAEHKNNKVILFDYDDPRSGSIGDSRIVRTDYGNRTFMATVKVAAAKWKENYPSYIKNCVRFIAYRPDQSQIQKDIDLARQASGMPPCKKATAAEVQEAFKSAGELKQLFEADTTYVYSPEDFTVNWSRFMPSRRSAATKAGVQIKNEKVLGLEIVDEHIALITTEEKSSGEICRYVVRPNDNCTTALGAWTQHCFEDWGIHLHAPDIPEPAAIISFHLGLSDEQLKESAHFIFSDIGNFESVPPMESTKQKFTWIRHKFQADRKLLSDSAAFHNSPVMLAAELGLKAALNVVMPKEFLDLQLDGLGQVQFCSMSKAGIPVISRHRDIRNLIVMMCDNFTSAKLAPILGDAWEGAIMEKPIFPFHTSVDHPAQPALMPTVSFEEMENLVKRNT